MPQVWFGGIFRRAEAPLSLPHLINDSHQFITKTREPILDAVTLGEEEEVIWAGGIATDDSFKANY